MARARTRRGATALERGDLPPARRARTKAEVVVDLPRGWQPAADVIDSVTAVRTIFPSFDLATRVGGLPLRRMHTVHGPTHAGKSAFVFGLLRSFVDGGHYAAYVDAEHATDRAFFELMLGRSLASTHNLVARRPETYEQTITDVDAFLSWVAAKRREAPVSSIVVVDSINKLVPRRELAALVGAADEKGGGGRRARKKGGDAIDQGWGRLRAQYNQSWLDSLTPRLAAANCALVLVAQEREDEDAEWGDFDAFKVKGGQALLFDASLLVRVSKAEPVRLGEDRQSPILGFRHRVRIYKSKVGSLDGRWTDCSFHLANTTAGAGGFDLARDAVQAGLELGVVAASGAWLQWRRRRFQGERRAVEYLRSSPNDLAALLDEVHAAVERKVGVSWPEPRGGDVGGS